MNKFSKKTNFIILTVLLVGYLIFNGILLTGHELWRDEANVWLFARDASPLQLLREIKYQGHPCLWYFLVMPFAKMGLPFPTISVLSFLVMAAAAGLFVYLAPFHPVTKFVCLFSPMFSYYYPVVARNYCLIALLLIWLAALYPERNKHSVFYGVLLGLLVQSDTIVMASAGLISLMWLWECIRESLKAKKAEALLNAAKGLIFPFVSLLFWIAQFYQVSDSPEYQMRVLSVRELLGEMHHFTFHILGRMTGQRELFGWLLIGLFLAAGIWISIKKKNLWPMLVMAGAFLFEVLFSIMVYQLHIWHYIALCFSLIWFLWVGNSAKVLSEALLIVLGISMFFRWNAPEENSSLSNALTGLYSDGVHVAAYMEEAVSPGEVVLTTDVSEASTVQAYLGKDYGFYYAGSLQKETYAKYNEEQSARVSWEQLKERLAERFPDEEAVYLLVSPTNCIEDVPDEERENWEIAYQTKEKSARGEDYTLYRIALP